MNFKFPKRKTQFGKPNFNYKNQKKSADRLRFLKQPVHHKISLKELDMLAPVVDDGVKLSEMLYDKKGNLRVHVIPEIHIDRLPESLAVAIFDNPNSNEIELENGSAEDIRVFCGQTLSEISVKYKIRVDLPSDRDKRSRILNCMGEEIQMSVKNKAQELFQDDDDDDDQEDLDKDGKAKAAAAEAGTVQ